MRWIANDGEFKQILLDARRCVYTDSGRIQTNLQRLQFDDAFFRTPRFGFLLKTLMEWSGLEKIYFTVLDPDPDDFFRARYGMYPCFELEKNDFPEQFIEALNKPYGTVVGQNLGTIRWEFTFSSPSMPWFVHALQSNERNGGHLWVPSEWPEKIFEFDGSFIEAEFASTQKVE